MKIFYLKKIIGNWSIHINNKWLTPLIIIKNDNFIECSKKKRLIKKSLSVVEYLYIIYDSLS